MGAEAPLRCGAKPSQTVPAPTQPATITNSMGLNRIANALAGRELTLELEPRVWGFLMSAANDTCRAGVHKMPASDFTVF